MSFEAATDLSKMLGWAFNQDATVVTLPHAEGQAGIPAIYALGDSKLTREQFDTILKLAKEKNLDFSETIDGKGVKFLYFGDEAGIDDYQAAVAEIARNAGLQNLDTVRVRSELYETQRYLHKEVRGEREKAWHRDSGAGPSSLFRRAVDNVLAPYIRLIEQEGYRFSTRKFADLFGHSDEEARFIEEAVHPQSDNPPSKDEPPSG